jgi:hypothetical protein
MKLAESGTRNRDCEQFEVPLKRLSRNSQLEQS